MLSSARHASLAPRSAGKVRAKAGTGRNSLALLTCPQTDLLCSSFGQNARLYSSKDGETAYEAPKRTRKVRMGLQRAHL